MDIKFANMYQQYEERGERSVITMTLYWHSSQVSSLGNCVDNTPTEAGLIVIFSLHLSNILKTRIRTLMPPQKSAKKSPIFQGHFSPFHTLYRQLDL